jgi:iron complex transport system ATP-binding protein
MQGTESRSEEADSTDDHATGDAGNDRSGTDPASDDRQATTFTGEELTIGYAGGDDPVIDGESLAAEPGKVTALVGPNGSGKSTLLKGLADQLSPNSGTVLLDGADVQQLESKELARKLGLLTQENASPGTLSVEKLVEHGRYPHRGFFERLSEDDVAAIDRAIELAGIDDLRHRELSSLSGGQKQLVWIAMVLAQETDVLLLDEPTTFLDLHHQLEVMEILEALRDDSEKTVVVVLHDLQQAARHADYMLALDDGAVQARGPPEEVVTEELLAEVFDIEARVTVGEQGPQITPLRPLHEE